MAASSSRWDNEEVFLAIQIPYFNHPDFIGRGGASLQALTEETKTLIHFPDINKRPHSETKSNKVATKGAFKDVAHAREILRNRQPFSYIIIHKEMIKLEVERLKRVLTWKLRKSHTTIRTKMGYYGKTHFIFRSSQQFITEFLDVMKMVKQHLIGVNGVLLKGYIILDVAPYLHEAVMGPNDEHLTYIEQAFDATIHYDRKLDGSSWASYDSLMLRSDGTRRHQKQSTVVISGTPETACQAWKYLLPFLPVTLSFKVPGDLVMYDDFRLGNHPGLRMDAKSKSDQTIIYLSGPESEVLKLYTLRECILDFSESAMLIPTQDVRLSENRHRNEEQREEARIGVPVEQNEDSNESGSPELLDQMEGTGARTGKLKNRPPPLKLSPEICTNTERIYPRSEDCHTNIFGSEYRHHGAIPKNSYYNGRKAYENERDCARNLMDQGITEKLRSPTSAWSGYLHSHSLPNLSPQKLLPPFDYSINQMEFCCDEKNASAYNLNVNDDYEPNINPLEKNYSCSLSNYFDNLTIQQRENCNLDSPRIRNLKQLLQLLDFEMYEELFSRHNINLMTFLMLKEMDFKMIGIKHSHYVKMLRAINVMKQPARHQMMRPFNPIVGSEREKTFLREATDGQSNQIWSTNGAMAIFL